MFVAIAGCSTDGARNNPFDPEAPPSLQAPARLEGSVNVEASITLAGTQVIAVEAIASDAPLTHEIVTGDDGTFVLEMTAGTFNVTIRRQGYTPQYVNGVQLYPGDVRNLGIFSLSVARGQVSGSVSLADGRSPTGTAVSLIPLNIPGAPISTVLAAADGSYFADALAEGDYQVRATRDGYAPAYTAGSRDAGGPEPIAVTPGVSATAPALVLYPAGTIVRVTPPFTAELTVQVELERYIDFLSGMRLSEDETFVDPAWDVDYRAFSTQTPFALSDVDGEHLLYVQFLDTFGAESEVFVASTLLDRTAPEIISLRINDGAAYLTSLDGAGNAALSFTGKDSLSGIDGWRWTTAASFGDEAFASVDTGSPTFSDVNTVALGDDNGVKTVLLQLRDRAGNVSEAASASIIRDRIAPVLGAPALSIEPGELDGNNAVRSLDVTLLFDIEGDRADEPLFMAIANAQGLDGSSFFFPLASPYAHRLAEGPDSQSREVCVIFRDAAGLLTEQQCLAVDVDRTGSLSGLALLEGETSHSGILVEVASSAAPTVTYSDVTDATGAYQINGIPGGSGYVMRFFKTDFVEAFAYDVTVLTGTDLTRGPVTLAIPRSSLTGTVTLVDQGEGQHGGIVIADGSGTVTTVTSPSGYFVLSNLPAVGGASYVITARAQGYIPYSFNEVTNLAAGETRNIGGAVLQKQQGDFRICANGPKSCPGGAIAFSKERTVLLDVTSANTFWRYGLDSTFAGGAQAWLTFNDTLTHLFTFDPGEADGPKGVHVQFSTDGVSVDGVTQTGVVTLDTTAPVPAAVDPVVIDPDNVGIGAAYNNHPAGEVTLHLAATDVGAGVASVRIDRALPAQAPDFTGLPLIGYYPSLGTTLDTATQGAQWLYVQFCDAVGNCTATGASPGDDILYDTVAPSPATSSTVQINDGDTVTGSPFVTVNITSGDAIAVRFGNTEELAGKDYVAVNTGESIDFGHILPLGDGTKTVYAQYRDAAGNESPTQPNTNSDTIILDTQAPTGTALSIVEAPATNQNSFTVRVTAVGAANVIVHVGVSEDFSGESWTPFTGDAPTYTMDLSRTFPTPYADGAYTVYVKLEDDAGNLTTTLSKNISRDTVAPQYASVDFLEGDFTTVQTVNLELAALGADRMIVAADGVLDGEIAETYTPAKTIDLLPGTVGLHTVQVRYLDTAGNFTDASKDIMWDGLPPSLTTFTIAEAPYTTNAAVTLQLAALGASRMRLSNLNNGFSGAAWEPFATTRAWTLLPGDAAKTVYLQLQDDAGNTTSTAEATTTLDTTPPSSLSVSIAAAAAYTTSSSVTVDLSATDNFALDDVMLANDPLYTGGTWVNYATSIGPWSLGSGDGVKTVYVRFKDSAGNISEKADTIIVDTQNPTAILTLASGATATSGVSLVPVSITGTSDVQFMKFVQGTGVNCSAQTIDVAFNPNTSYSFTGSPSDGPLNLTVCLRDFAGRVGSAEDDIILDTLQPAAALAINGGTGLYTRSGVVTLTITASDAGSGVDAIRLANQQDMTGIPWDAYTSPRTWTVQLPSTDGLKTVWLEVRDRAGIVHNNVNATINLDTAPPSGSVSVVQGAFTTSASVDLTIARGGDTNTTQMAVAQGFLDCNGATYGSFAASVSAFALSGGDGLKNISLCLKDLAGNTAGFSSAVTLDTANPTGTLRVNSGAAYSQGISVTLNVENADADVVDIKSQNGAGIVCGGGGYAGSFNPASPFNLTASDGVRTVSMCLKDAAGRTTAITDTIILDTADPTPVNVGATSKPGIVINGDDAYTNLAQVGLSLAAADTPVESGVTEMKISDGAACVGGNWQPYVTSASWTLQGGDNVARSLSVQFRDAAGRSSSCSTDSITVDTVNSTITLFTVNGGGTTADYTNDASVSVTGLTYQGTCSNIQIGEDPNFGGALTRTFPCNQAIPFDYTLFDYASDGSKDGQKTIYARITDAANNPNPSVNRTIILDTQGGFSGSAVINGNAAYTNSQTLSLALTAANATDMYIATNGTCTGGSWQAFATATTINHPSSTSPLSVSVRFRDAANNTSGCIVDTINYDPSWGGAGAITIVPVVGTSPFTTSLDVNVQLSCGEAAATTEMKISNVAGCSGGVWQPYPSVTSPTTIAWTLASGGDNVQRTVSVIFRDAAGNQSGCYSDDVDVDTVAPSGLSLTLDSGAIYNTNAGRVAAVSFSGIGFSDARLSESPAFVAASWATGVSNPYVTTFTLSNGSGTKTVYAQGRDAAGNVSVASASDSIIFDNTPPTGQALALDAGAAYTTSLTGTVNVALGATDDASGTGVTNVRYRTSVDGSAWSIYTTVGYQPNISLVLAAPVATQNGVTRYVELAYLDAAGNIGTTLADTIILDNVTPALGGSPIVINSGATFTTSQTVSLALSASGATEMQIANGQVCSGGNPWQAYGTSVTGWSLDGVGDNVQKYVSVRFRDAAGNTSTCASTSIYVDNVGPVAQSFAIESGATYTNKNAATPLNLNIIYSGTATQRFVATTVAGLDSAPAENPATAATFTVSGATPDGTVTLYVRFADGAGNTSAALSDTIILDRTAPSAGPLLIDNGAIYSTHASGLVSLSLSATDGTGSGISTVSYRTSVDGSSWGSATVVSYQPTLTNIALTAPVGSQDSVTRHVQVSYTDAAGNTSGTAADTILLDNLAPSLTTLQVRNSAGDPSLTNNTAVTVHVTGYSGNPTTMRVSNSNNCTGGQLVAFQSQINWVLGTAGETTADVSVRLFDDAGLSSGCITDGILVDTVPPDLSYISLDGRYDGAGTPVGSDWYSTRDCNLRLWNGYVVGGYSTLELSMSASFNPVFQSVTKAVIDAANSGTPFDGVVIPNVGSGILCDPDGSKTIYMRAVDSAGNPSGAAQASFNKDTAPPTFVATTINYGDAYTGGATFTVTVDATDSGYIDQVFFDSSELANDDDVCTGSDPSNANSPYYGSGYGYTYVYGGSGSGVREVYVCLRDGAGNTTADDNVKNSAPTPPHQSNDWDDVRLDTDPPVPGSPPLAVKAASAPHFVGGFVSGLTCTGGTPNNAHWRNSTSIVTFPSATDGLSGVTAVKIAEGNDYAAAPWNVYNSGASVGVVLTAGDGPKLLGVEFQDAVGNVQSVSDAVCVTLDTVPPENVTLALVPTANTSPDGAYTWNQIVDATLGGTDYQSSSTNMEFCVGAGSSLVGGGSIYRSTDITFIGVPSTSVTCSTGSNWYPFESNLRFVLSGSAGNKNVVVFMRDAAGNKNVTPATLSIILDNTLPTVPSLNVVESGNRSAHLFWTAAADPESGLARYEIDYRTIQPSVSGWTTVPVDADLTDVVVTGLDNRKRYELRIRAINRGEGASAFSAVRETAVGWQRSNVAFSSTNTIIPFGVAEYGGAIYVGYLKYEVLWGTTASTVHLGVSTDGGTTWRTSSVDSTICQARETAAMYVGAAGVVIFGVSDTNPADGPLATDIQLTAWRSVDQGVTWVKNPALDGGIDNIHSLGGFGLTTQGGALVGLYQRSTDFDFYMVRSYDGGVTWTSPLLTFASAAGAESLGACNTQFNVEWFYRDGTVLYINQSMDLGASSSLDETVFNVNHATIACSDPTDVASLFYGRSLLAYTPYASLGGPLYVRSLLYAGYTDYWDTTSQVVVGSGVDPLSRPALYTAGTTTTEVGFLGYRDTSGNLWVGESTNLLCHSTQYPGACPSPWVFVQADKTGNIGVNMVINGTAEGSPILAYTDDAGQQLFVLRSATPAPSLRAFASEDSLSLLWNATAGADSYLIDYGTGSISTPDTSFYSSTITGVQTVSVTGVDAEGQAGEPGMRWQMAEFTPDSVATASANIVTDLTSRTGSLIVNYNNSNEVFVLPPVGFSATTGAPATTCNEASDICVYYSSDGGDTFTGRLVYDNTGFTQRDKHMLLTSNGAGGKRLHVAFNSLYAPDLDLVYRRADSTTGYATWTGLTLDGSDTDYVGDATGAQVQVSAYDPEVLVTWVAEQTSGAPVSNRNIRYRLSQDLGATFAARSYVNNTNTDVDIGYTPTDLSVLNHSFGNEVMLAWIDGSNKVRAAHTYDISLATPTWNFSTVSGVNDLVTTIRATKYVNSYTIAWLGRTSGLSDSLMLYLGGINAYGGGSQNWVTLQLDSDIVIPESLALVQERSGTYITYATTRTLFGIAQRYLKLAYCKQECTGLDNWHIMVLRTANDFSWTRDFGGVLMALDSGQNLLVSGGWQPPVGADQYILERGGRFVRLR